MYDLKLARVSGCSLYECILQVLIIRKLVVRTNCG